MDKPITDVYKSRRKSLCSGREGEAFILFSGKETDWVNFRVDRNFYYLTGFKEPDAVLLIRPGKTPESILFLRPKDPSIEIWDGPRLGVEKAVRNLLVDEAKAIKNLEKELPELLTESEKIHHAFGVSVEQDDLVLKAAMRARDLTRKTGRGLADLCDPNLVISNMRMIKTESELHDIRKACQFSAEAHKAVMSQITPGMNEKEVHGRLLKEFYARGCEREGYFSIVAAGVNATVLHYRSNDQACKDGDLILIDAGAEVGCYTADITRTYPIGTKFTLAQKELYSAVLETQEAVIARAEVGLEFSELQIFTIKTLSQKLIDLGFLKGSLDQIIEEKKYSKYYPHGVSHYLGLDVHDKGLYKLSGVSQKLQENMVFTIEPGLYIPLDDKAVPEEFRGQGVRIEDDILLTSSGAEVLTSMAPKTISELQSLRSSAI